MELVSRGIVRIDFRVTSEIDSIQVLMKKFREVTFEFIDATVDRSYLT